MCLGDINYFFHVHFIIFVGFSVQEYDDQMLIAPSL